MDDEYPFSYEDGTRITVRLFVASSIFRYVRVFNLPPEIDDTEIATVLGQYGTIRQHIREKFAANSSFPVFNGVRGIHMEVAKELPANIIIARFKNLETPKQLNTFSEIENTSVAVKSVPSVEATSSAEDDHEQYDDGVDGDNDADDDDDDDDDDNDDDAEMESEKVNLKRTISSPSSASEKEKETKKKKKVEEQEFIGFSDCVNSGNEPNRDHRTPDQNEKISSSDQNCHAAATGTFRACSGDLRNISQSEKI
ncbi:uncharacterized protein LOC129753159 [Uranotaenia lowii]|uniref:uncharacterized protein LOC129753159 n=1 Tax=Uranotaenia lowii TaxID=190385 RepID=UPI00247B09E5|nr:uncharacterized protein LOC129753159 [Uranotaenia lowii]